MINSSEILQTLNMFNQQHLDIRTITMGISLLDCADPDPKAACQKVYDKICKKAEHLVATGQTIEKEFGIPIVNKRVSVTPISLVASASNTENYAPFAAALDKAAKTVGINFIGGLPWCRRALPRPTESSSTPSRRRWQRRIWSAPP